MHAFAAAQQSSDAGGVIGAVVLWIVIIGAYWIPTIVAWVRHVPNAGSVTIINGFLGWTLVGWIVALAMACRSHHPGQQVTMQQTVTLPPAGPPQESGRS
jgi:hypothetical protein